MMASATATEAGRICTPGYSWRARAEAHQRSWRRDQGLQPGAYGHLLTAADAAAGRAFAVPQIHQAVLRRNQTGKGVNLERTTGNLLSSQALAFNVWAALDPADQPVADATSLLAPLVPEVAQVLAIRLEYTPPAEVLGDQSAHSGVDADVRIDFRHRDGGLGILLVEVKFVEPGFSACGYRRASHPRPCHVPVLDPGGANCRYSTRHVPYRYWERSLTLGVVHEDQVVGRPCPFAGPAWQPWVNLTLARALADQESRRPGAEPIRHAWYAVLAPAGNTALVQDGAGPVRDQVARLLTDPTTFRWIGLESLIRQAEDLTRSSSPDSAPRRWARFLNERYMVPTGQAPRNSCVTTDPP